ncbi:MAG: hypothetical protein HND53_02010 [Proteobacteria bacterium]|nr:hypothetical protein [Pseudomonadota bacterium]NOG59246.1 hypothetical protein [Pseudomonadota bacterium]
MSNISQIEEKLYSKNKSVRLKALKLMLKHPDSTSLQLIKCLCSSDNRNFEFFKIFELEKAMHAAWDRIKGVTDESIYIYLTDFYKQDEQANFSLVEHILLKIDTKKAAEQLQIIKNRKEAGKN